MTNTKKFSDLKLDALIQKAIEEQGYERPTPIQEQSIPYLLEGKDLLGCAQTGTGKTAAFALPILQHLHQNRIKLEPKQVRTLILSPTRELAVQIHESFLNYGKHLKLKYSVIFGGVGQGQQVASLSHGVDVLIATPGRLLDLMKQRCLFLNKVEIFVLDEADRMLDMGFLPDIKRVLPVLPKNRQTLFFSATMPKDIKTLADSMLNQPINVKVAPVASTAEMINQSVMYVDKAKKKDLLMHLLDDNNFNKVIIFTRTKHGANRLSDSLMSMRIKSEAIHGNKSQNARQRALENLRNGKNRVLVATDIVARGIDIDNISHVINYELPADSESYVHRIGRTARAGAQGIAISLCDSEERSYLRDIEKLIGKAIPIIKEQPFHSRYVEEAKILSKGQAKAIIEGKRGGGGGGRPSKNNKRFFNRNNKPSSGGNKSKSF
jgi:ATP-dependent RNA helicase RhlE